MRKVLSWAIALTLVGSLVPAPALAEARDEMLAAQEQPAAAQPDDAEQDSTEEIVFEDVPTSEEATDGGAEIPSEDTQPVEADEAAREDTTTDEGEDTADDATAPTDAEEETALAAQATRDPFYVADYTTGERVTTLHTSGTYLLVNADNSRWLGADPDEPNVFLPLYFTPVGGNAAGLDYTVYTSAKVLADYDDEGNISNLKGYLLEGFGSFNYDGCRWLPTGTYTLALSDSWDDEQFSQQYKIKNDGNFWSYIDFASGKAGESFSVKPYTEGADDDTYAGIIRHEDYLETVEPIAEQDPYLPASDVRLKIDLSEMGAIEDAGQLQLDSIGLWKTDDDASLENLTETYGTLYDYLITRATDELADPDGEVAAQNPGYPTYLNASADYDDKVTVLWERGSDDALNERLTDDSLSLVVDYANFSGANVENGLYFPIVRLTYEGQSYVFAYYPIEVDATGSAERVAPRITTKGLPKARKGEAYETSLAGKAGARPAGELTWTVTAGALPEGLALDAANGTISGTPQAYGSFPLTVTLTETVDGDALAASRSYTLSVADNASAVDAAQRLELGNVQYTPGTLWLKNSYGTPDYLDFTVPVTPDLRDYDLGQTELWYLLEIETGEDSTPACYVYHENAADLMSADGATLSVHAVIQGNVALWNTKAVKSITCFLVPKTNEGAYAFDMGELSAVYDSQGKQLDSEPIERTYVYRYGPLSERADYFFIEDRMYTVYPDGDYSVYANAPEMAHTECTDLDVQLGSWVAFPVLDLGDQSNVREARVRVWAFNGTKATGEFEEQSIAARQSPTFTLAPGTYAFSIEGSAPVYDDAGVETGEREWVDIVGKARGCTLVKGSNPKQYVFGIGPNEGSMSDPVALNVSYTNDSIADTSRHAVSVTFELTDGSFATSRDAGTRGYVQYETAWYRRQGDDESSDVLVATGDSVLFGPSSKDLYVEVTPTGRDASFWASTGKIKVSANKRSVSVQVPRKRHFRGTFTLSCATGRTPQEGSTWGILEVLTPTQKNGYTSRNLWASTDTITVDDLTSGSVVTYTPAYTLGGGSVSYEVPEDAEEDFAADLVAPVAEGTIHFEGLNYTDVNGNTSDVALDDGATEVSVERVVPVSTITYPAPFYQADGATLILQPESLEWYSGQQPFFMYSDAPTTYRITVTHYDTDAPTRMGTLLDDYAARTTFEVSLSQSTTEASIPAATLVSRGYGRLSLPASDSKLSTLLLYQTSYDEDGALESSQLVEKAPAGWESNVRTPYLDAGSYRLYTVDANLLGRADSYNTIENLQRGVLSNELSSHAACADFEIEDGRVSSDKIAVDAWSSSVQLSDLVDKDNSSIRVEALSGNNLSIQVHAQLAKGASASEDAYLEIATNQPSEVWQSGYMNPKALVMNGKTMRLNRWENLFDSTQNMQNGNLSILLAEAKKQNSVCADFPLDLSLAIPRTDATSIDVSVWLVSENGKQRSLVGSYSEQTAEATLEVPELVAWKSFYVYGETAPSAQVTVLLNGVRAASAKADQYGYWTAEVSLPDDVGEFEQFSLSALAQWKLGERSASSTTPTKTVSYTSTYPVVERIMMCYQSMPGEPYLSYNVYYRGKNPNEHLTLYRAEIDANTEGDDHAKHFWLVDFANGDFVSHVTASIPHGTSSVQLETSDSLATAKTWIPDLKNALTDNYDFQLYDIGYGWQGTTGAVLREAFRANDTHTFVTKPYYFNDMAPDRLNIDFDFDGTPKLNLGLTHAKDVGRFEGFASVDEDDLSTFLGALGTRGNLLVCNASDVAGIDSDGIVLWDARASISAHDLASGAGTIDEWMLLGSEATAPAADGKDGGVADNLLLKLHHEVTTTELGAATVKKQVQDTLDAAQFVIEPYESWIYDDDDVPTGAQTRWGGRDISQAAGTRTTLNDSYLYYISTLGDDGIATETMQTYYLEDSDSYIYLRTRADRQTLALTTWSEKHGQRVDITYTIADDQVDADAIELDDLVWQWTLVMLSMTHAIDVAGDAVDEQDAQGALSGQSTTSDEAALTTLGTRASDPDATELSVQNLVTDVAGEGAGIVGGAAKDGAKTWSIKRLLGIENLWGEDTVKNLRNRNDITDPTVLNKTIEQQANNTSNKTIATKQLQEAVDYTTNAVENIVVDGTVNTASALSGNSAGQVLKNTALTVTTSPATQGCSQAVSDALDTSVTDRRKTYKPGENWLYDIYWKQKWLEQRGKSRWLWIYRMFMDRRMVNDFQRSWQADYDQWRKIQKPLNKEAKDPSGIVYEGVLSNPVEGATVQLFTYNANAAAAGYDEVATFVDSARFGIEENPQVTAKDGRYQWFVPDGFWQIRVSKSGYESFSTGAWGHEEVQPVLDENGEPVYKLNDNGEPVLDEAGNPVVETRTVWVGDYGVGGTKDLDGDGTDDAAEYWMPVLPVQLDVNIPLKSTEAPVITEAVAEPAGVKLTFSKYMDMASVRAADFTLGGATAAKVEPLDAEAAGDGSQDAEGNSVMLARTFRLSYPADMHFEADGSSFELAFVSGGTAVSYAGVGLVSTEPVRVDTLSLKDLEPTITVKAVTYNKKAQTITPTVKVGNLALKAGQDYTVSGNTQTNAGTYTLTVTGAGIFGKDGTRVTQKYTIAQAAQTVTVKGASKGSASLTYGKTFSLNATTNGDGTLSYASSNKAVLTVTSKGVVKPVKKGKATVTVSCKAGKNYKAATAVKVTITVSEAKQTITAANKECVTGKSVKLAAKTSGDGKLTYKSSNTKIATVDAKGVVKGKKAGTAKITITVAANGHYAKATKTVSVKVAKANPLAAKAKKASVTASVKTLKSKAVTLASNVAVSKAQGKVTYANASTNTTAKKFKVAAGNGKITLPKGTKKGTYQVVLTVKAAGNKSYIAGTKTVKFKIQVK